MHPHCPAPNCPQCPRRSPTNGDNEVWNLAPAPDHYDAIVAVMRLREDLREYVSQINAVTAATGLPMVRPMFLQYPADPGCQGADVEDQFMFGPDWLVAPVYTQGATSRSVYLPRLTDGSHEWVYWWNQSSVGAGGGRITWSSPSIGEFPLYVIRPVAPAVLADATSLFSTARSDSVLCVVDQCTSANTDYAKQRVEGAAVAATADGGASITLNGTAYPVAPLTLWFSFTHNDNFVATNTTPPDASYTPASGGVTFANGYVLTTQAPGSVPLQVWFKDYDGANWDCEWWRRRHGSGAVATHFARALVRPLGGHAVTTTVPPSLRSRRPALHLPAALPTPQTPPSRRAPARRGRRARGTRSCTPPATCCRRSSSSKRAPH